MLTEYGIDFKDFDSFDDSDLEEKSKNSFNIVNCFEVFMHTTTPIDTITDLIEFGTEDAVFVMSTQLLDRFCDDLLRCSWHYVAPKNGHISIYSANSIAAIGGNLILTIVPLVTGSIFSAMKRR